MTSKTKHPYQAFTIKFGNRATKLVSDVRVSIAFDPTTTAPHPKPLSTHALWDTGANQSIITKKTAEQLKLISTGLIRVRHAGGTSDHRTYVVNISLPNNVILPGRFVTKIDDPTSAFGVIIGMDIITMGDLAVTNPDSKTIMSFRVPAFQAIDFHS